MSSLNRFIFPKSVTNHSAIIHPPGFYIIGFKSFSYISAYIFFLVFVYLVTVVFNGLLMYIIAMDNKLHTPKFLAVVNLAVIDALLNTSTIPGMVKTFIFLMKDNFIPFNLCLVQMFFYYTFVTLESCALAVLAYDRLVVICFPLRQHSVNTLRSMTFIISVTWSFTVGIVSFSTAIMTRLSFCNSLRVFSYFCDYAPVFRLACNDYTLQWLTASILTILCLGVPFGFILLSYTVILVTVFRMKSLDSRKKALSTCVEHLILVAVFYIPILVIFLMGFYLRVIDQDQRVLSLSLASCIPPCINPMVYSLKTKAIKVRALAVFVKK
uniref:G-protein coupled receptors family 1 profile domain-containing protein n=1 Tax=Cynoglossus semilaevis TaxID=244447 RepID=A0A3P8W003_CYNSE